MERIVMPHFHMRLAKYTAAKVRAFEEPHSLFHLQRRGQVFPFASPPIAFITLDTKAAGHGWFIGPTPGTNEEHLPTSNPNEMGARAGSAAAGKMDMLSVLMREYGHALGQDQFDLIGFGSANDLGADQEGARGEVGFRCFVIAKTST